MDKITFGKHKGLTIDRVANVDPTYIDWMKKAGICNIETVHRKDRGELLNDKLQTGSFSVWTWD